MRFDIAARRAELSPEADAVWFEGRWYSYAELNDRAERLARALAARGVVKGDRVSILARNHLAHVDLVLATAKLGFIYAPLNYRLAPAEQAEIIGQLRPEVLFYEAESEAAARVSGLERLALEDYPAWLSDEPAPLPPADLDAGDCQMILLTGGTTGTPKGAMQPYRQGFYNAVNTVMSWGLRQDDCVIQATPCFHAAFNAFSVPLLHLGARIVLQGNFEPGEYLRLVGEQRASLLFMVPTMYRMLAEHPDFAKTDFSRIRWAISGGAPCPEPVRGAFTARGVDFKLGYGLTEAGVNCFSISLEQASSRPTSVGKPVLHAEAAVVDAEGRALGPAEVGELVLRGPHVFSGYFEKPEETTRVLRDGWLYTGDLAHVDSEGFFYIVGRRKEMFVSGGENVYPIEIEAALYRHGDVAECAVIAVPDARWGEAGAAFIVLREDAETVPEDLRSYLKGELAAYKLPKYLRVVENLPKSAAGKILKTELSAEFAGEKEAHA